MYFLEELLDWDYETGNVVGRNIFDITVTTNNKAKYLTALNTTKVVQSENVKSSVILMSPNDYYKRCADLCFPNTSAEELKRDRSRDFGVIKQLREVIDVQQKQFPITYIDYTTQTQDGLHRMMVAAIKFGWGTKFPVLIIEVNDMSIQSKKEAEQQALI